MHIALPIDTISNGGTQRVVAHLAQGLVARGHQVDLIALRFERSSYLHAVPAEVRIFLLQGGWADFQAFYRECRDDQSYENIALPTGGKADAAGHYLQREAPDCILPALPHSQIVVLKAFPEDSRTKVIPLMRNVPEGYPAELLASLGALLPRADHIVGVSKGVTGRWASRFKIAPERVSTIYNPVTPDIDLLAQETPDHPWMTDAAIPVVLACGRLARQKDYTTLLHAFSALRKRRVCRLVVLGQALHEQSEAEHLRALVGQLSLQDIVDFPGWKTNPYAWMARASAFVLSSRHEGLPNVLIEALACGTPVVSTDCPSGPSEILENGRYGTLVPVGDVGALAAALEDTLAGRRPASREDLRASVTERFEMDNIARRYEELMESVCEGDGAGA